MRLRYLINTALYWAETSEIFNKIPKLSARRDSFRIYWRENRITTPRMSRRERRAQARQLYKAYKAL